LPPKTDGRSRMVQGKVPQANPLRQGPLVVCRKGRSDERFFVLYHDRLDYFSTKDDASKGVEPRGRLALHDVRGIKTDFPGGFALTLESRDLELKVVSAVDLQPWLDALMSLTGVDVAPAGKNALVSVLSSQEAAKPAEKIKMEPAAPEKNAAPTAPSKEVQRPTRAKGPGAAAGKTTDGTGKLSDKQPKSTKAAVNSVCNGLQEGNLSIFRKGKLDQRYFVLFEDRFEYFGSAADRGKGERRGCVVLQDITDFEDVDMGFKLNLGGDLSQNRSLELRTDSEKDLDMWLESWRGVLAPLIGAQFVVRRTRAVSPTASRAQVPTAQQAVHAATKAGGPVKAPDAGTEPTGAVAKPGGRAEVQPLAESGAQAPVALGAPAAMLVFAGLRQAPGMDPSHIICEGALGVVKKGGSIDTRYFVLFIDRLEYFTSRSDFLPQAEPRGRVALADVVDMQATSDGFKLMLIPERAFQVHIDSATDREKWDRAWKEVFCFEQEKDGKSKLPVTPEDKRKEERPAEVGSLPRGGEPAGHRGEPAKLGGEAAAASSPAAAATPAAGSWATAAGKAAAQSAAAPAPAVPTKQRQEPKRQPIHHGLLSIERRGKLETRYFSLYHDCLEYFSNVEDMQSCQDPRGRIQLHEIQEIDVVDNAGHVGFSVKLADRSLTLEVPGGPADVEKWEAALKEALAERLEHDDKVAIPTPGPGALLEGLLTIARPDRRGTVERHCVLLADRLEFFASATDRTSGKEPEMRIALGEVMDLEVLDDGFCIEYAPGKKLTLMAPDDDAFKTWSDSLAKLFAEADDEVTVTVAAPGGDSAAGAAAPPSSSSSSSSSSLVPRALSLHFPDAPWPPPPGFEAKLREGLIALGSTHHSELTIRLCEGSVIAQLSGPHAALAEVHKLPRLDKLVVLSHALGEVSLHDVRAKPAGVLAESPECRFGWRHCTARPPKNPIEPRLVWQSMLEVQGGPADVWKYFILYEDGLLCYPTAKHCAEGGQPQSRIPLNKVRFFVEESDGFVIHLDGGDVLDVRVSNAPGILEAWMSAWNMVLVMGPGILKHAAKLAKGEPALLVHQGPLEVERGASREMRYLLLYEDRLESYADAHSTHTKPTGTISLHDITDFKVNPSSYGFSIKNHGLANPVRMHALKAGVFEAWIMAWEEVFNLEGLEQGKVDLLSCETTDVITCGALIIVGRPGGKQEVRHCILYEDRLDYFASSSSGDTRQGRIMLENITGFRITDDGFLIKAGAEEVDIKVVSHDDLEHWLTAFRTALNPDAAERRRRRNGQEAKRFVPTRLQHLQEHPLLRGPLGIQHEGRLTEKHFLLYRDRLDYFDSTTDARADVRPRGRIAASDVSGFEVVGSGFVLDLMGRKIGLHAEPGANLQTWASMLDQVFGKAARQKYRFGDSIGDRHTGTDVDGWGVAQRRRPRSTTPRKFVNGREMQAGHRRPPPGRALGARGASPPAAARPQATAQQLMAVAPPPSDSSQRSASAPLLEPPRDVARSTRSPARCRGKRPQWDGSLDVDRHLGDGGKPLDSDVTTSKIVDAASSSAEGNHRGRVLRRPDTNSTDAAEKVTGDGVEGRAASRREAHRDHWAKIGMAEDSGGGGGSSSASTVGTTTLRALRREANKDVTPKPTDRERRPRPFEGPDAVQVRLTGPSVEKITDGGRAQGGWFPRGHAADPPVGVRSHAVCLAAPRDARCASGPAGVRSGLPVPGRADKEF